MTEELIAKPDCTWCNGYGFIRSSIDIRQPECPCKYDDDSEAEVAEELAPYIRLTKPMIRELHSLASRIYSKGPDGPQSWSNEQAERLAELVLEALAPMV